MRRDTVRSVSLVAQMITRCSYWWVGAWLLFGFVSVFAWTFGAKADVISWRYEDQLKIVEAEFIEQGSTGITVNGSLVQSFTFAYMVDGARYESTSYSTRESLPKPLLAEYIPAHPQRARLKGHRFAPLSPWALVTVVFPVLALIGVVITWRIGARRYCLLRYGQPVEAEIISQQTTNVTVNKRRMYAYGLRFDLSGEPHEVVLKTSLLNHQTIEAKILLLADPRNPQRFMWAERLPDAMTFNLDYVGHTFWAIPRLLICLGVPAVIVCCQWWAFKAVILSA